MSRKKRSYNTRRIRLNYPYSLPEIAELFDLHKNTVRLWLKTGLALIDRQRPYLVHGSDLIDFLKKRQSTRKQKCQANEFFCLKCRVPRRASGNRVLIQRRNSNTVTLSAECAICSTRIFKAGSIKKIQEYAATFHLQQAVGAGLFSEEQATPERAGSTFGINPIKKHKPALEGLIEPVSPTLNCYLKEAVSDDPI